MEAQNTIHPIFKWVAEEDDAKTNNKIILTHVAFKGIPFESHQNIDQVGAQTGSIAMALFQFLYFRRRIRVVPFYKAQVLGTFGTSIASVGGAYYMVKTSDPARNYDRAFRSPPSLSCYAKYARCVLTIGFNITVYRIDVTSIRSCYRGCLPWPVSLYGLFRRGRDGRLLRRCLGFGVLDLDLGLLDIGLRRMGIVIRILLIGGRIS